MSSWSTNTYSGRVSAPHELLSGGAILARDGLARAGAERADGWGESATRAAGRDESCGRVSAVGAAQSDSGGSAQSDSGGSAQSDSGGSAQSGSGRRAQSGSGGTAVDM